MAHYYACKFGVNRLRIYGDIRENRYNGQRDNCNVSVGRYKEECLRESVQRQCTGYTLFCEVEIEGILSVFTPPPPLGGTAEALCSHVVSPAGRPECSFRDIFCLY